MATIITSKSGAATFAPISLEVQAIMNVLRLRGRGEPFTPLHVTKDAVASFTALCGDSTLIMTAFYNTQSATDGSKDILIHANHKPLNPHNSIVSYAEVPAFVAGDSRDGVAVENPVFVAFGGLAGFLPALDEVVRHKGTPPLTAQAVAVALGLMGDLRATTMLLDISGKAPKELDVTVRELYEAIEIAFIKA